MYDEIAFYQSRDTHRRQPLLVKPGGWGTGETTALSFPRILQWQHKVQVGMPHSPRLLKIPGRKIIKNAKVLTSKLSQVSSSRADWQMFVMKWTD